MGIPEVAAAIWMARKAWARTEGRENINTRTLGSVPREEAVGCWLGPQLPLSPGIQISNSTGQKTSAFLQVPVGSGPLLRSRNLGLERFAIAQR